MRRIVVLVLLLLTAWHVDAQTSPTCPYYAVNSSNAYSCFPTLAQAEAFLRADPDGTHPTRRFLEHSGADPSNNPQSAVATRITYSVKPRQGVVGPKGHKADKEGSSAAYLICGCDTSGSNGTCVPFGPESNCTNQPAICTYNNYCSTKDTLKSIIETYFNAQPGNSGASVTAIGVEQASPLGFRGGVPDNRPIYPPNTGTLLYQKGSEETYVGERLRVDYTNNGSPRGGTFLDLIAAPLTCPQGFNISPGSPPITSEACTSNESGYIMVYRAPAINTPPKPCPNDPNNNGCGLYGNPVVPETGAKLQAPLGWSRDAMLGLTLSYNSLATSRTYDVFGDGWTSLLSARFLGANWDGRNHTYADELGNWEIFSRIATGEFRAINSSGMTFRGTSSTPCERTIFEGGRRLVFNCGYARDSHLLRVEYPADPKQNLTVTWSATETFDSNGVQIGFFNVPVTVTRADGRELVLSYTRINTEPDCEAGPTPYACNAVRLTAITDSTGGITLFDYNSAGRLRLLTYPDGDRERFEYGAPDDICPATMPGACNGAADANLSARLLTGLYQESLEAGQYASTRYGIYQYDNYGRAIVTTHLGDAGRTEVRYSTTGTPTIRLFTDATQFYDRTLGTQRVGVYDKPTAITDKTTAGTVLRSTTPSIYGANGYVSQSYDFRGNRTDWTFHEIGLPTQSVEAANDTSGKRRTIQTEWDIANRVATERRVYDSAGGVPGILKSRTVWALNSRGQVTATCAIDVLNASAMAYSCGSQLHAPLGVRQSTTSYCEQVDVDAGTCPVLGLVTSVNGPRTDANDITTYSYYPSDDASCATQPTTCPHRKGDLWKVTNALGKAAEILTYDGAGRPLSTRDANGVVTDLEYHVRGWLTARKVRGTQSGTEVDDAITRIDYWPTGLVKKLTQPDGEFTTYTYDAARRLTDITDNLGNSIHYTLDHVGNRTGEDTNDSSDALLRTLSRVYNQLGQLETTKDAYLQPTGFLYDANGNSDKITDALNRVTDSDHDALNRLSRTLQDVGGIAAETGFNYDALDNLTKVTDPKGLETNYVYNSLGDLKQLTSPDTGVTEYTYDSAGNRQTQLDARGITTTYSYDALNRMKTISYSDGTPGVIYIYDANKSACLLMGEATTFVVGRLDKMTDASGSTQYCYDRFGNVSAKKQVTNGKTLQTSYTYTLSGRLKSVTYPSGGRVDYVRNALGQPSGVTWTPAGGTPQVLLSGATYYPFGPAAELEYGDGRHLKRTLNQNYQPGIVEDVGPDGLSLGYEFDAVGNLFKLRKGDQGEPPLRRYEHDGLNRLTETHDGGVEDALLQGYEYDDTGNRTSATVGAVTTAYAYQAGSHRLDSIGAEARGYDNVGNTTAIGGTAKEFVYNGANRMSQAKQLGAVLMNYAYNGKGEQVRRYPTSTSSDQTYAVYDEAGHVLGTYASSGTRLQEMIWLDDLPVGVIASNQLHYVQADHLGTPRTVIHPGRERAVWRWDLAGEAFGNGVPNSDPDADGTPFVFDLRFPGQRYDGASGLAYNYFRDYDSATGRYVESDPIGLAGGVSTFGYALGNPLLHSDALGLVVKRCCRPAKIMDGRVDHCWLQTDTKTAGMGPSQTQCTKPGDGGSDSPFTPVYVQPHQCEPTNNCVVQNDVDEQCVNKELAIGKHLGVFTPWNNCQTFALQVLQKCRKDAIKIPPVKRTPL